MAPRPAPSENTLKITQTSSNPPIERTHETTGAGKRAAQYSNTFASSHAVDLSTAGRQLAQLHSGDHDVNMEKVAAIQQAIANGELKIDTSNIADSLLSTARDLMK